VCDDGRRKGLVRIGRAVVLILLLPSVGSKYPCHVANDQVMSLGVSTHLWLGDRETRRELVNAVALLINISEAVAPDFIKALPVQGWLMGSREGVLMVSKLVVSIVTLLLL